VSRFPALLSVCVIGLAACERPSTPSAANLPTAQLNDAVGEQLGGPDTCVVLLDAESGALRYQYGLPSVCARPLPPCATFEVVNSLIGLDSGLATPDTVFEWDGSPQQVTAWEKDADLKTAFRQSIGWWHQALALRIGPVFYGERLKAYDYGNASLAGPPTRFWMGPGQGGGLAISTRDQARFLQRLHAGRLPVNPASVASLEAMTPSETRQGTTFSGKAGSCDSLADGSRSVGWSIGHLRSPDRDLVFATSIEGQNAFPGFEVENRLKAAFAGAGLWPEQ